MRKILILTYYFRPSNYVAANRANTFSDFFAEKGWDVTVVTRNWTGNEKTWPDYLSSNLKDTTIVKEPSGVKIHYLPYQGFTYPESKALSFVQTAKSNLLGNYNFELDFNQYQAYITELVQKEKFDYVLVSSPPLTVLKVASKVCEQFNIKLLVDIRDFENDILLQLNAKPGLIRSLQHKVLMQYFNKWVKHAHSIFTVSPPLTDYIKKHSNPHAFTLTNGFDDFILTIKEPPHEDYLNISIIGTLYREANLDVLKKGIELLFAKHQDLKVFFNLIGVKAIPEIAAEFEAIIPAKNLNLTHRLDRTEALKVAAKSHVLLLAGFDSMKGVYTTKVFEYLGLRKNVLLVPGDRDVIEELLEYTKGGIAPHTPEEFYNAVMKWYKEWLETGNLAYQGINQRIEEYSRRSQFEKLFEKLT